MSKSLYEMKPSEEASTDEWKRWAEQLQRRAIDCEERYKKAKEQTNTYRKQIKEQQGAFVHYKSALADRDNTIENIKKNRAYNFVKSVNSLWGRIKARVFGKNA